MRNCDQIEIAIARATRRPNAHKSRLARREHLGIEHTGIHKNTGKIHYEASRYMAFEIWEPIKYRMICRHFSLLHQAPSISDSSECACIECQYRIDFCEFAGSAILNITIFPDTAYRRRRAGLQRAGVATQPCRDCSRLP